MKRFILESERAIRCSISGENPPERPVFDTQTVEEQGLRVFVYSRILMLLVALVKQGQIPIALWRGNEVSLEKLYQKLLSLKDETPFKEKRQARYAVACIKQARETLGQQKKQSLPKTEGIFTQFINWLQEHCQNDVDDFEKKEKEIKDFVEKVRAKENGWFDFHIIVSCLVPLIHENPKIISVLRKLVVHYASKRNKTIWNRVKAAKWPEEALWQTGLLLANVLENLVLSHKDDTTRKQASASLCFYVDQLRDNKNSTEKFFLEKSLQQCFCGSPSSDRTMLLSLLKTSKEEPITPKDCMVFVQASRYKKQISPPNFRFIGKDEFKALFKTYFRSEEALVKIALISSDEIRRGDAENNKQYENLLREAYSLRRLNSCQHPNILRVFGYDTSAQPYHLITEYVHNGNLLQYLQHTRSDIHNMPNPSSLIKMAIGIVDGLIYIIKLHLVHLAITSDNVLVGKDKICKITGFQALREMPYNQETHSYEYFSLTDETSIRHSAPEVMINGHFTEKSMVFSMGYILYESHTYGITPYNWHSNEDTDKIRSHVMKGGRLPEENCISPLINKIIAKCQHQNLQTRTDLVTLKVNLEDAHEMLENTDADRPSAELPPLSEQDLKHSQLSSCTALDNAERLKISGIFGSPTNAHDFAVQQNIRGIPQIRERIEKTKEEDLKKLKDLEHKHLVKVLSMYIYDAKYMALMTENSEKGDLLSLVLAKQCTSMDIIRLLVQALSGLVYMHDSNIVHCDICAEHLMVFYTKNQGLTVKISRLGRSTYLKTSPIEIETPKDSFRRNPPEVIKHSMYSCSSDVWQFCLMCYELYIAQGKDEACKPEDVHPFASVQEGQILPYLEDTNNRPTKPPCMPEFMHITVKQGLLHNPEERPPLILLYDTLTHRKPFESCLLTRWKEFHPDLIACDKIDVDARQPQIINDHVIPSEEHLSFDDLKQLAPVAVFMKHSYIYEAGNQDLEPEKKENEIYDDAEIYEDVRYELPRSLLPPHQEEKTRPHPTPRVPQEKKRRPLPSPPQGEPPRPLPPPPQGEPHRPLPPPPQGEPHRPLPPPPQGEPPRPLPPPPQEKQRRPLTSPPQEESRLPLPPPPQREPHSYSSQPLYENFVTKDRPPQPYPRNLPCPNGNKHNDEVKAPIRETAGDGYTKNPSNISTDDRSPEEIFRPRSDACWNRSSLSDFIDDVDKTDNADVNEDATQPHYENLYWLREIMDAASDDGATEQSWHSWDSLSIKQL